MMKFLLLLFMPLYGKVTFDFSQDTPRVLRSVYPAIKAAEMPHEKKIYTKEIIQHTHIATGLQYESPSTENMVDISMNLGMSKKPLGVKESIFYFSFPKVMMYKKIAAKESFPTTFFGAGFSYDGIINDFSSENARSVQAGLSMGMEIESKNKTKHLVQLDLSKSIRERVLEPQSGLALPKAGLELSYGANF
jgi:hypothetical protein